MPCMCVLASSTLFNNHANISCNSWHYPNPTHKKQVVKTLSIELHLPLLIVVPLPISSSIAALSK
ncbi:hypothetical protein Hanom_Chr03g00279381 [Helianthus anomalus]